VSRFEQLSRSSHWRWGSRYQADLTIVFLINNFERAGVVSLRGGPPGTKLASPSRMTQRNVEALIGRLATDPDLRRRFDDDPVRVLHELRDQGFELSAVELEALAATDAGAVRSFGNALDRRLRRAAIGTESVTHR
jgi:hypothetical protein